MLKLLLALVFTLTTCDAMAHGLSGRELQTLHEMIDQFTGKIIAIPMLCQTPTGASGNDEVKVVCDESKTLVVSRDGQQYEDLAGANATGGISSPDSTTIGALAMWIVDNGGGLDVSNVRQLADGTIEVDGDIIITGKITTKGPSSIAIRLNNPGRGDAATCATIGAAAAGRMTLLNPLLGDLALCIGSVESPLGTTVVSWSNGTWVDDNCWKADQSFGADATCTSEGTELNRAPDDMFAMRWCCVVNDPDTSMPVGEGSDIELYINSSVIDTMELGKLDSFDGQGETLCKNLTTTVAGGVRAQIRTQENAATCETGTGCVLPIATTEVECSLFWRFNK